MTPFGTARLGPGITDITAERCDMSIVLLQGGGLSQRQIDEMPLRLGRVSAVTRRILSLLHGAPARTGAADRGVPE
jgi:hypothetical protein